jgi:hypothetical protein
MRIHFAALPLNLSSGSAGLPAVAGILAGASGFLIRV